MTSLPSISREYVEVPFADHGGTVDAGSVELALVLPGAIPAEADWHPAAWDGAVARLLIGAGGTLTTTPGTVYVLWLRFTAGLQRPVRATGYVVISDEAPA
ncbi:hypothetical protein [Actinomadura macra]|uniref:hypothetical protein n=1 Tax=Actinomadura macra TaxID=46164 RepID=UPI000B1B01DF|nr:hypothetical protein [Actinomadura macra]